MIAPAEATVAKVGDAVPTRPVNHVADRCPLVPGWSTGAGGVRVNAISPGAVATPMWEFTDLWPKRIAEAAGREAALEALGAEKGFAEPEEVVVAVLFLARG